jgi:cytochrome c
MGANVAQGSGIEHENREKERRRGAACHSLLAGQHIMGPSLNGLIERRAGTVDGFNFSIALRDSGVVWTGTALDAF